MTTTKPPGIPRATSGFCGIAAHHRCPGAWKTWECNCGCHTEPPPAPVEPAPPPADVLATAPPPTPVRHCATCTCEDPA